MAYKTINMAALALVIVVGAGILHSTEGVVYQVGDAQGWQTPSDSSFYATWASNKSFTVGDILVFNFITGAHDVASVTQDAYNNCNTTVNAQNVTGASPVNITLTAGTHYYICTFDSHCSNGQKLSVRVASSTSPSPPPASPPTNNGTSTPPSESPPSTSAPPSESPPSTSAPPSESPPTNNGTSPPPPPPPASGSASSLAATYALMLMSFAISLMSYRN